MKRKDDSVREKLRQERTRATVWLRVLVKGVGSFLADDGGLLESEDYRSFLDRASYEIVLAAQKVQVAEAAYKPYWRRRIINVRRRKAKASKAA